MTMFISLLLTNTEDSHRWFGVCQINKELFKVTLWPGSATEEWQAQLQPATFVELTEGNKLRLSIERAHQMLTSKSIEADVNTMLLASSNLSPEILDKIKAVLIEAKEGGQ